MALSNMAGTRKRLGYWLSQKKCRKLSVSDIEDAFRENDIEPVKIDLDKPLDSQGPFDGILHKLTDFIAKAELGDEEAVKILGFFETYVQDNPNIIVMDPIERLRILMNRYNTYSIISKCQLFNQETAVFIPSFVELQSDDFEKNIHLIRLSSITFPAVCKPVVAHGSNSAHQMTLIFNENGLKEVVYPCVVQTFVNHNAVLYKLFALGQQYSTVLRPSIRNFYDSEGLAPIHFDGTAVSKPNSSSRLPIHNNNGNSNGHIDESPCPRLLNRIMEAISECMGLGLIGVDVIVEANTGRLAIVDVNAFPGYDGVADFPCRLATYVREKLDKRSTSNQGLSLGKVGGENGISNNGVSGCENKSKPSERLIQKTSMA